MMRFLLLLCLLAGSLLLPVCSYGQIPSLGDDIYSINEGDNPPPFDILANDEVLPLPLGTIDPSTVDLDPITLGIQGTASTPEGEWSTDGSGMLTYVPAQNFFGTAEVQYNVQTDLLTASLVPATVTVTVNSVNDLPTITSPGAQSIAENTNTAALSFTINDVETALDNLILTASSDNTTLIPNANIVFGGTGAAPTVTVTPAPNQFGSSMITLQVEDEDGGTGGITFTVTVTGSDDPPTVTDVADLSIPANTSTGPLAFTVTDTDSPWSDITVSASSDNLTLVPLANIVLGGSAGDRTIDVTPAAGQSGSATITITVNDLTSSVSSSFVLTVTNTAPNITSIADQSIPENSTTGALAFAVTDAETAAASLAVSGTSSNTTLVPNTNIVFGGSGENRTVTVTPAAGQSGTSDITIVVSDGSLTAQEVFTVTVNANTAPTISAITDQSIPENSNTGPLAFVVTDAQTAATSLTVSGTSSNTTLVPNANIVFGGSGENRTVTVTPAAGQSGTTDITIVVSDGTLTAQEVFTVTVNANTAPTITAIADQSIPENSNTGALAFVVSDAQTAAASLAVSGTSSNTTLVPNANIVFGGSGENRTVTVTPTAGQSGTSDITIVVSDGILTAQEVFTVTVNANTAPTITAIADQSIPENSTTGALAFVVTDAQTAAASLTVSGTSSNTTLVPNANIVFGGSGENRTVTVTPAAGQSGTSNMTIAVSDGTLTAQEVFTVTVNANTAPTITPIQDQTISENSATGALAFVIGDAETPGSLTVSGSSSNVTLVPNANIVFGGSGTNRTVTITPVANQSGVSTITIQVSDGALTNQITFALNVNNALPSISAIENQSTSESTAVGPIGFTVSDAETPAAALTLSASSSNTALVPLANIVFGGSGSGRNVTVTPTQSLFGTSTIIITVTDGANNAASEEFLLTVTNTNDPPTITFIDGQTTAENTPTPAIAFSIGDAETAATSLGVAGTSDNTTLVPNGSIVFGGAANDRTVTITPAANQSGEANITISVSDPQGATTSITFQLTVTSVNSAPTITAIENQTTQEDVATAALPFTLADADTPLESLTLTASSSDKTLVPDANIVFFGTGASRTVTVTPAPNQSGTTTITLSVKDEVTTVPITFTVTVSPVNDAPTITTPAAQSTAENTASAPIAVTIADIDSPVESLSVSGVSGNATLIPNANIVVAGTGADRTVTITPAPGQSGATSITLTVSDGPASSQISFPFTVTAVNDAPTITAITNQTIAEDGATSALTFTVGDQETPASLTVSGASSDHALILDNKIVFGGSGLSRTVTITPEPNEFGTAIITLTVSDGTASTQTTFSVTVTPVNDAPVITANVSLTTPENTPITFVPGNFTIVDPDNVASDFSLMVEPGSYTRSGPTLTPQQDFDGALDVFITVSDNSLKSELYAFKIMVTNVNVPPVITGQNPDPIPLVQNQSYPIDANPLIITPSKPKDSYTLTVFPGDNYTLSGLSNTTITPALDYIGPLNVVVQVNDGIDDSNLFTLKFDVQVKGVTPIINGQETLVTNEDQPLTIALSDLKVADDRYPTGYTLTVLTGEGSDQYTADGNTITPLPNINGEISVRVIVSNGIPSATFLAKVFVVPVNDAPQITAFEQIPIAYEPGSGPIPFTEIFECEDIDSEYLNFAEVRIDSSFSAPNDELIFDPADDSPIRAIYDASRGILSMIGYATKSQYIEAIRSIQYNYKLSTDETGEQSPISTDPKYVSVTVNDGQLVSERKSRSIELKTSVDLDIPNAFTPNGDPANNTWAVQPLTNSDQFDKTVVRVFNKRGLLIYEAVGLEKEWDGTYKGEDLPADTYYYTIDLQLSFIKKTYKGAVMILR